MFDKKMDEEIGGADDEVLQQIIDMAEAAMTGPLRKKPEEIVEVDDGLEMEEIPEAVDELPDLEDMDAEELAAYYESLKG